MRSIEDLKEQFAHRQVWMASSIHKGEEEGELLLLGLQFEILYAVASDKITLLCNFIY